MDNESSWGNFYLADRSLQEDASFREYMPNGCLTSGPAKLDMHMPLPEELDVIEPTFNLPINQHDYLTGLTSPTTDVPFDAMLNVESRYLSYHTTTTLDDIEDTNEAPYCTPWAPQSPKAIETLDPAAQLGVKPEAPLAAYSEPRRQVPGVRGRPRAEATPNEDKRKKNNEAVRRSREKTKRREQEQEARLVQQQKDNDELRARLRVLERELDSMRMKNRHLNALFERMVADKLIAPIHWQDM